MKQVLACVLALVCLPALAGCSRPYRELDAAEIATATVCLSPPDKTFLIEDTEELAALLREVVLYEEDDSYTEYAGQGAAFSLEWTDGTQTRITAFSPFLIVDGVGYQAKKEPCQMLSRYANRLMNEEKAPVVPEALPPLLVNSDRTAVAALRYRQELCAN